MDKNEVTVRIIARNIHTQKLVTVEKIKTVWDGQEYIQVYVLSDGARWDYRQFSAHHIEEEQPFDVVGV